MKKTVTIVVSKTMKTIFLLTSPIENIVMITYVATYDDLYRLTLESSSERVVS